MTYYDANITKFKAPKVDGAMTITHFQLRLDR